MTAFIFLVFILLMFSTIITKLLKGNLGRCINFGDHKPIDKIDCLDYGGDWMRHDVYFDSIGETVFSMY